jgi:penicillin G amidase
MRWLRYLGYCGAAALILLLAAAALGYGALRASLPRLDGGLRERGLSAPVRIARDARGVPTLEAASRLDLAYATGFVHAQDRFFQMDLARRLAAGELAELFGSVALEEDRKTRLFRFRSLARTVLSQATPAQHDVLEAYASGVNAGLRHLGARPWEYWLLGSAPRRWRAEDTILVSYSMWWDMQANGFAREIERRELNARLGGAECAGAWKCALAFLYPPGTSWDAPDGPEVAVTQLAAAGAPAPPSIQIPDAGTLNVRESAPSGTRPATPAPEPAAGSNNWAVAGRLTASGAALIANDMHLGQRVPPVWYHARLRVSASADSPALDLNGVTLPGAPVLVAGSNGHIAWGFTNSYGSWLSVTRVPCSAVTARALTGAQGTMTLSVVQERIRVHGAPDEELDVRSGPPGLLLRVDDVQHACWFGSWLAQQPAATNLNLMDLERAGSVAQALALAPQIGIPHQNAVIGDAEGHIGWTIFGRIPEDTTEARAQAAGPWTSGEDHPRILDPPSGRLWTANARVAADAHQLALIGGPTASLGAQYNLGARAQQIRDDLLHLSDNVTPADMLRIQLDDRALFLARWRTLLLSVLDSASLEGHPRRAELRALVRDWKAEASVDSVGYRLVRTFRLVTQQAVWDMLLAGLDVPNRDDALPPEQFEGPLWEMVTAQPLHLLSRQYASWPEFLRAQVDATLATLARSCAELARCTWGARNTVSIRHPLSRALPWLASFLDMPTLELPGDHDMPRVQDGVSFGASERFAVSPGHEDEGYLLIPGGQSGHPLSPYYRAGFMEWARGVPLPLLPGPPRHTLTLSPRGSG